jgi:hypothetical protein
MVHSGHGTARLDQVRFGGLAASCGGLGEVRSGEVWSGGRGSVGSYKVRLVKVWRSRRGRSGLLWFRVVRSVTAVVFRCALVW